MLEGRWKLVILFHLFDGNVLRFSELERAIPSITQKMLSSNCGLFFAAKYLRAYPQTAQQPAATTSWQ